MGFQSDTILDMEKDRASMLGDMDIVPFTVRLPPDLHEALKAKADEEGRSMQTQLIHSLKKTLKLPAKPSGA